MDQEPAMGYRNPRKMRTKDDVVRASEMQQWHLKLASKRKVNKALRQNTVLEVVKLAAGSSVGIRIISVRTLCEIRPPPKRKNRLPKAEEPEIQERQPLSKVLPAPIEKDVMAVCL
jgi:hypothetical protein